MRIPREQHIPMFSQYSQHPFSEKLKKISIALDSHPDVYDLVHCDLTDGKDTRGARGMSSEQVLRAAILMRSQDWTYKELEYNLADSQSARAFMHMVYGITFSSSALQESIKGITAETWEAINRLIVVQAKEDGFEKGRVTRTDSTVSECNIHYPTDSTLIVDCLRVISRVCFRMKEFGADISMDFTHKRGRKIALQILSAKNAEVRLPLYRALIEGAGDVFLQLPEIRNKLAGMKISEGSALKMEKELRHIQDCMEAILAQTIARVIDGKHIEAKDKVVSVFESHTDVITKGQRDTQFGHKINLTTGRSNLVIDCTIEDGNPNDSEKFLEMLDRQKDIYGVVPRQTTCDGGYASKDNVAAAKERGVKDVCFSKRCGIDKEDMCKSKGIFNKLRNLRAGIEANISTLKRAFGFDKVTWKGLEGYKSYIWSTIVSYNLMLTAK